MAVYEEEIAEVANIDSPDGTTSTTLDLVFQDILSPGMDSLQAWGDNEYGKIHPLLGDYISDQVVKHLFVGNIKKVCAGRNHIVVLTDEGNVYCWGDNSYKQSDPTNEALVVHDRTKIIRSGVIDISAGEYHTMCVTNLNRLNGWGWNQYRQVTSTAYLYAIYPTETIDTDVVSVSCGRLATAWVLSDGQVCATGDQWHKRTNPISTVGEDPATDQTVAKRRATGTTNRIANLQRTGLYAYCHEDGIFVTTTDGLIWGWGSNLYRCVDPTCPEDFIDASLPSSTTSKNHWRTAFNKYIASDQLEKRSFHSGGRHTVFVDSYGRVFGWGTNYDGEINPADMPIEGSSFGHYAKYMEPLEIYGMIEQVMCGNACTFFISDKKELLGIGHNVDGRVSPLSPERVIGFSQVETPILTNIISMAVSYKDREVLQSEGREDIPGTICVLVEVEV